jgi:hypothetical protein
MICDRGAFQKSFKKRLVIAPERDIPGWKGIPRKSIEYTSGIRAAIDIVSQRDRKSVATTISLNIAANFIDDSIEKIRAAMNIANDVQPKIMSRNFRPVRHFRLFWDFLCGALVVHMIASSISIAFPWKKCSNLRGNWPKTRIFVNIVTEAAGWDNL